MNEKTGICVLGSLNIDQTVRVDVFPRTGQSVTGISYHTFTGGKGGNQAVAAARLGGKVRMAACVGRDLYGDMYLSALAREGVDAACVARVDGAATGTAVIEVQSDGENRIVYIPGANAALDVARVDAAAPAIGAARCLLMQLETPLQGIERAAGIARAAGTTVILDPAPACPVSDRLLALCDYVTPNETELSALTGLPADTDAEAEAACRRLLARGAGAVLHKRGARGAMLVTAGGTRLYPAFRVTAVDTTAAGDTFNAGFAVGLCMGQSVDDSIRLANAAAAISTTGLGAQTAMPTLEQTRALIAGA